ncbi:hypothetical protein [Nakamurella endophytica]|uniref:Uncharacterized protein n=1 Tax=Nakamurella endophytica TaxID=1748367 RepID=A0A917WMT2_9ACTN|nr:hypothetical protein [Nakamurella endophytica]GGM15029.1 hypothetical protein GCM10011594_38790 [Nakamurella endophytica]
MTPDGFKDFFVGLVGADGALIGLLFVAVSLAPRRLRDPVTAPVAQAEAASALLIFTNVLVIGLFALMPVPDIGWATIVLGGLGIAYALAVGRVALAQRRVARPVARSLRRISIGCLVLCGWQVWAGIEVVRAAPGSPAGFDVIAITSTVGLVFGISRAWELIGLPGTGFLRALHVLRHPEHGLAGRHPAAGETPAESDDPER